MARGWNCSFLSVSTDIHELTCHVSYGPCYVGYKIILYVSLHQLFPQECCMECPSDHDGHGYIM